MLFYRTLLTAITALALTSSVFAAEPNTNMQANPADNAMMQTTPSAQQTPADIKVNLNTASTKELMKVKGINASKARAIVAYRKKHGHFKSMNDLAHVKGFAKMKPAQMQKIETQLIVE